MVCGTEHSISLKVKKFINNSFIINTHKSIKRLPPYLIRKKALFLTDW